jgi:precorrin-6A/cobalt-precorrin-6A reductase
VTGPEVLVLGGTAEARRLAEALVAEGAVHVVSSLAGRVRSPALPPGEVRVGGFGGPEALAAYLRERRVAAVVDATHPFAATITAHAASAAAVTGTPLVVLRRPGWTASPGDRWHRVPTLEAAARALDDPRVTRGERVLLTTGRQGVAAFAGNRQWFLLRVVDPPDGPLPARTEVLRARGPFTPDGELRLLAEHAIDVVVTKDSGGDATSAKLAAARRLGLPVVVVDRPPLPAGVTSVADVAEARRWLDATTRMGR